MKIIKIGQVLFTKDGRKIGNAVVVSIETKSYRQMGGPKSVVLYTLKTDFGNEVKFILQEILDWFFLTRESGRAQYRKFK